MYLCYRKEFSIPKWRFRYSYGRKARTIWRRVASGSFPKPIKIFARFTAWRAEEVKEWIGQQRAH
ncbi:helix-turn-helix transcriptional regulator [Rosenbergiella metrosideri]|uniref:helix-turn-helix transcriptional regulator n=1 Tax=Rosenbergiella metrosideri TaxID=2921185 RepID=UPI00240E13FF|nr:AlpA family phage regulatory protein [Rosenbergiella metrosideri]